jgi:hypothetical protein
VGPRDASAVNPGIFISHLLSQFSMSGLRRALREPTCNPTPNGLSDSDQAGDRGTYSLFWSRGHDHDYGGNNCYWDDDLWRQR